MFLADAIKNDSLIIIIVIVAIILVVALIFVINYFVISRKRYIKQIKDLENKYSYLDALMIGQDSQYIRRLEMISRTNLLYVDIYNEYYKKYKEVFEIDDKFAEGAIKQLKSLVNSKQFKGISKVIAQARLAITTFENNALILDEQLSTLIKPEEEARRIAVRLKENLRAVKQKYSRDQDDLTLVGSSFEKVFAKLDNRFVTFETHIEGAEYDEANNLLPIIDKVINQLDKILDEMPSLCILVDSILPEKINSLKAESESLSFNKYPLHHLLITNFFNDIGNDLEKLKIKLKNLDIVGVQQSADEIQFRIEEMHNNFGLEVEAKGYFEQNCDVVYQKVLNLEKNFLRLVSLLPEMNRIYSIDENEKKRIEDLKEGINELGGSKRSLDTFIHSATHQPYSVLKEKLEQLTLDYQKVYEGVNNFKVFLESLRTGSEEAYSLVFSYYYRLKQCEQQLQAIGIDEYTKRYTNDIEYCYDLLNEIDKLVKATPIQVTLLNEKVDELKTRANDLFDLINQESTNEQLAESSIVYANRDRNHQTDVHKQLLIAERQFYNGDFQKTYYDVVQLLKRKHIDEGSNN